MKSKGKKVRILKSFTWFIVISSVILVIGSLLSVTGLVQSNAWFVMDKLLTKMAEIFSYAAVILIISRMAWKAAHQIPFLQWIRSFWLFVKLRHVLFGWIAFSAGAAHSIYFLIFIPGDMNGVVSGLIAFGVMVVMVFIGYMLDQKAKTSKAVRVVHTVLGIAFVITMLIHSGDVESAKEFNRIRH